VRTRRQYNRADLFLVRLWSKESADGSSASNAGGPVEWHGKVQRVVDGEAHQFRGLQGLVDALLVLLADNKEREER
jgi:hypothetical protein